MDYIKVIEGVNILWVNFCLGRINALRDIDKENIQRNKK